MASALSAPSSNSHNRTPTIKIPLDELLNADSPCGWSSSFHIQDTPHRFSGRRPNEGRFQRPTLPAPRRPGQARPRREPPRVRRSFKRPRAQRHGRRRPANRHSVAHWFQFRPATASTRRLVASRSSARTAGRRTPLQCVRVVLTFLAQAPQRTCATTMERDAYRRPRRLPLVQCYKCHTTPLWHKDDEGKIVCHA